MGLSNLTGQQVMDDAYLKDNHLATLRKAPLSVSFVQQRQSQQDWLCQQQQARVHGPSAIGAGVHSTSGNSAATYKAKLRLVSLNISWIQNLWLLE